jgi:hypothetical protein
MITERDIPLLEGLAKYRVLNRRLSQRLYFPTDIDGRITRRRHNVLERAGYLKKTRMLVVHRDDTAPCPVIHLTMFGCQFLAERFHDDRYLLKPTTIAQPMHLHHYLAVASTHILVDEAIRQSSAKLITWVNEEELLNPEELDPKKHIRLYTELRREPRRLVCAPDAGFLLEMNGHRGVFYLEQDRDRDNYSHKRVAALKSPGYAELHRRGLHRFHFPTTTLNRFTVLLLTANPHRRDALRRAFRDKDGNSLWRFASQTDVTADSLLHESIWFSCDSENPEPLVKQ